MSWKPVSTLRRERVMELYIKRNFLKREVILIFFSSAEGRIEALGERWFSQRIGPSVKIQRLKR